MHGKTDKFLALKKEIQLDMKTQKKKYFAKECKKLTTGGAHRISFSALKNLNTPNRTVPWNVLQLCPDSTEEEALEYLAGFFNSISDEFTGLEEGDIPVTYDRQIYPISACLLYTSPSPRDS